MSKIAPNKPVFSHYLPESKHTKGFGQENYLISKKIFNNFASEILTDSTIHYSTNRGRKRLLLKNTMKITSQVQHLPYYIPQLRSSLRNLTVLNKLTSAEELNPFHEIIVKKALEASKHLRSISFCVDIGSEIFKSIRKLIGLQYLKLNLTLDTLFECYDMCQHLTSLQTFNLRLTNDPEIDFDASKISLFYEFFKNLLSLKNLQSLIINFDKSLPSGDLPVLETILSYISQSQVSYFDIQAILTERTTFDISKAKGLLSCLDSIKFHDSLTTLWEEKHHKHTFVQYNKSLTLFLDNSFDINGILRECHSIKSLRLTKDELLNLSTEIHFPKTLKHFNMELHDYAIEKESDQLISNMKEILKDVEMLDSLNIYSDESSTLSRLEALHRIPCIKGVKNYSLKIVKDERELNEQTLEDMGKQVLLLESLEYYKLSIPCKNTLSLKPLEKMLSSFPKLKGLKLLMPVQSSWGNVSELNLHLPLEILTELTVFELDLGKSLTEDCGKQILKNLKSLKKMKSLTISSSTLESLIPKNNNPFGFSFSFSPVQASSTPKKDVTPQMVQEIIDEVELEKLSIKAGNKVYYLDGNKLVIRTF